MPGNIRLTNLPRETLVQLLRKAGSTTVSTESIAADIAAGAPVNADGTMSLVSYMAWLCKQRGEDAD